MRLFPRVALSALLAAAFLQLAAGQTAAAFHFDFTLAPGRWPVGLRVVQQYDSSRPFTLPIDGRAVASPHGRPLQILVWYPARRSHRAPMTIGDYAALIHTETSFTEPMETGQSQNFMAAFTQGTQARRMWSVRDAKMRRGRFPIVVYAPSIDAPSTENIELCEYLASHGYVVVASPSMGASSRKMTASVPDANAQAQDISLAISLAAKLPDANASQVAVIGYSWGGMGALFAAARDDRIRALIAFDGSFDYSPALVQAGGVHPDQMSIPLLFFSRAQEPPDHHQQSASGDSASPVPGVLGQWTRGDLLHLQMLAMSHIEFCSLYLRSERFRTDGFHFDPAGYSPQQGAISYNWTVRYTLEFLDAYLRHRPEAVAFLGRAPAENGVPPHLIDSTFRAANPGRQAIGGH